jgi:hypothetical protein
VQPCPAITRSRRLLVKVAISFLRVNERPNFIALNTLALQVYKDLVMILRAGAAKIAQQFHNRCAVDTRHATNGAQRISFNQSSNNRLAFVGAQFVDGLNMLERSRTVNKI